jgi:hypothetical protein
MNGEPISRHVNRMVLDRQMLDLSQPKFCIGKSAFARIFAGAADHFRCHIHTNYAAGCAYLTRGKKAIKPAAFAQVQHNFSRLQPGNGLRIATAEAKVRPIRNGCQFF